MKKTDKQICEMIKTLCKNHTLFSYKGEKYWTEKVYIDSPVQFCDEMYHGGVDVEFCLTHIVALIKDIFGNTYECMIDYNDITILNIGEFNKKRMKTRAESILGF